MVVCGVVTTICSSTLIQCNIDLTTLHFDVLCPPSTIDDNCCCRVLHAALQQTNNNPIAFIAHRVCVRAYISIWCRKARLHRFNECRNLFAIPIPLSPSPFSPLSHRNGCYKLESHERNIYVLAYTHTAPQLPNEFRSNLIFKWFKQIFQRQRIAVAIHFHSLCVSLCSSIPDLMGDPLKRYSNHDWVLQMDEAVFCHVVCTSINDKIARKRATSWANRPPDSDFRMTEFRLLPI